MARRYTTAFAASRALHDALAATSDLDGVRVAWGYPGEDAGAEIVWVGEIESGEQDPAAVGQRRRTETYAIGVYVDIAMTTADPADVGDRVGQLVRAVETVVHSDPHLGGALHDDGWAQIGGINTVVATQPVTEAAYANVTHVRIDVRARI